MGLCLPLAVLLGYLLAEPLDSATLGVVIFVLVILALPIMMKWHHPLLIFCWNVIIYPWFIPGCPGLWMIMSFVGLIFALVNRSISPDNQFVYVPSIAKPLFFLLAVVLITAGLTGGFNIRAMGSEQRFGGKGYVFILASVAGFFALTSRRVPANRAPLYVAIFFLAGITPIIGTIAEYLGPKAYLIQSLFSLEPPTLPFDTPAMMEAFLTHFGGLNFLGIALASFLLARYGVRALLNPSRPWRLLLLLAAAVGMLGSGYRGSIMWFVLTLGVMFCLEGLHRTALLPLALGLLLAVGLGLIPFSNKLPHSMQRTLSFLPFEVDPVVKESAVSSNEWRLEIWRIMFPQVPKYLIKGKGYSLDPSELYMASFDSTYSVALIAQNYHNGFLSIIIPFGIFGVIGLVWFLVACLRYLNHQYRFGNPAHQKINNVLFALFIVKVITFIGIFGHFYADLPVFVGLIGLSISLNGPLEQQAEEKLAPEILGEELAS